MSTKNKNVSSDMSSLTKAQNERFDKKFWEMRGLYRVEEPLKQHLADELWRETKRWQKILDDYDKDANKRCKYKLSKQKKEIIEELEKMKEPKAGGVIPVSEVRTFNFDSYKDGLDQAIKTIKKI